MRSAPPSAAAASSMMRRSGGADEHAAATTAMTTSTLLGVMTDSTVGPAEAGHYEGAIEVTGGPRQAREKTMPNP
jgi:hypothetical protein